ncbi:MAG: DUF4157 domain-containing protein [Acidimicrobiales bacterium]
MPDFDTTPEGRHAHRYKTTGRAPESTNRGVAAPPPGSARWVLGLQRSVGNAAVVQTLGEEPEGQHHPITEVVSSGGSPIAAPLRGRMEQAFGHDFSDVRVHSDAAASASAQAVGATAATVGNHIVFRSGAYDASSSIGQHLLAHELTHVVQQRSGPVDGTPAGGGIKVSDPSDRFETAAEANAGLITSQLAVQRQAGEEDEAEGEG